MLTEMKSTSTCVFLLQNLYEKKYSTVQNSTSNVQKTKIQNELCTNFLLQNTATVLVS